MPLSPLARRYDQFILDLDGCVWLGPEAVPGAPEAVAALREAGKRLAFATNNSRSGTEDYVARLWGMGIQASLADVVTAGGAMQHLLADAFTGRTAFVIGTSAMYRHVTDAGLKVMNGTDLASRAEVVVLAGSDDLSFDDLCVATLAVRRGAEFLTTSRDPTYPQPEGLWPGTGAIVAALETSTGRTATLVGKPEPRLFVTALDRLGEGRTLVVGDRVASDLAAAAAAGLDGAFVLSGEGTRDDLNGFEPAPVAVADDLGELLLSR